MTITNPKTVAEILRNGGKDDEGWKYPMIYSYRSRVNPKEELYALFTDAQYDDMDESSFVLNFTCLMANCCLTLDGEAWLEKH